MKLELLLPPDYTPQLLTHQPDTDAVASAVRQQAWNELTFLVLRIDDDNWFEISGSLNPTDGLSARFSECGVEHVSDGPPGALEHCILLLTWYLTFDNRWRTALRWC